MWVLLHGKKNMIAAKILDYDGERLILQPETAIARELLRKQAGQVELRIVDGRQITLPQRRKIFAIIRDISEWSGYEPEYARMILTWQFRSAEGIPDFSLSDVDCTTAKDFINYLVQFCFHWNVPTMDTLLHRTDDIDTYLYQCLEHRKCAVCNLPADIHHVDRVGMGRNRAEIFQIGMRAIALCRKHHQQAHGDETRFFATHHIYGISLDRHLCDTLNLNTKGK